MRAIGRGTVQKPYRAAPSTWWTGLLRVLFCPLWQQGGNRGGVLWGLLCKEEMRAVTLKQQPSMAWSRVTEAAHTARLMKGVPRGLRREGVGWVVGCT